MITRIELTNFMSHKHTVIEPAAGLTVLVGPNNIGKSAIVTALQILCHNDNSTYVLRHGEKECSIRIETDDGHTVEWRRKNAPSYVVDTVTFDRLRNSGLPDEVHQALRLPKVAANDTDFDIHFGTQKSPIFLLANSPANAARFFASSSDAIRFVAIQNHHKNKLSEAQRKKSDLETDSRQLNAALEQLEPAVDLDHRLETVERAYDELVKSTDQIEEVKKHESILIEQTAAMARFASYSGALSALCPPPELNATIPLANLITATESADNDNRRAVLQDNAIKPLTEPPAMGDVATLAAIIEQIATNAERVERSADESQILLSLSNPPQLADIDSLQRLVSRLASAERELVVASSRDAALRRVAPPPELALEAPLRGILSSLVEAAAKLTGSENVFALLDNATSPPVVQDTREIEDRIADLGQADSQVESSKRCLQAAEADCANAAAELREQAAGRLCPVCGAALDPDRVVARAIAPLGDPGHD